MPLPSYEELAGSTSLPSYDELARQPSFDTTVPFERVPEFEQWIKRYAPPQDSGDYDYGGAFLAGVLPDSKGHWPDTFKKPNHPTFSDESQYAKDAPERAGHWNGEVFTPHGTLPSYDELTPSGVTLSDLMSGKYGNRIPKDVHIPTVNETGWIPAPIVEAALRYGNPLGWAQVAAEHYDPNNPIVQAGKGAIQGLSSTIAGATTPENLSLLALAPEGKLAQRLIAGTFLGQSIAGTPEQWDAFNKADNLADKFKIGTEMGLGLALPAAGLAHSFKAGEVPKVEQNVVPESARQETTASAPGVHSSLELAIAVPRSIEAAGLPEIAVSNNVPPQPEITPPIVEPSTPQDLGKPEPQELSEVQGQMALTKAAQSAKTEGEFIRTIQESPELHTAIYEWEQSTPENQARFKNSGWFGIASDFWKEQKAPSVLEPNEAVAPPVSPKEFPQSATGEPNGPIRQRGTAQEIPSPIERGENQQVSGERVRPSEQGKEIAGTGQAPEESQTTGIAQRVHEKRGVEIEPGEGIGAEDQIKRGRNLISEGVDPNQTLAQMKASGRINADDISVLRARHEELGRVTNAAEDAMRSRPNDPVARRAYGAAWQTETNWAKEIKPFQTEWHKIGMAQQGEVDIDTGTFTGLRRAVFQEKGRDVRPHEVGPLRQVADKVQAATAAEALARKRLSDAVKQITRKSVPHTAEELRNHFANRIRKLTPC